MLDRGKWGTTPVVESHQKFLECRRSESQCTRFERAGVDIAPQIMAPKGLGTPTSLPSPPGFNRRPAVRRRDSLSPVRRRVAACAGVGYVADGALLSDWRANSSLLK